MIVSRKCLKVFRGTKRLAMPYSSSREMKQCPFAVPGRWRQMTIFITRMSKYGSGAGQLHKPEDIAVSQKEIYVVNYDGHRVEVFDLNGTFIRSWGKHGSNDGEFYHPSSIALDMNGSNVYEVFIADR